MLVLDISNYTGVPSSAALACWRDNGVEHVVVRLSMEDQARIDIARRQIARCRAEGFGVSGYLWGYLQGDPGEAARAALATYGDQDLAMWSLDLEEQSAPMTARRNTDWAGGYLI